MRPQEWEKRLRLFVEEWKSTPFAWGANDCCTFTLRAVGRVLLEDWTDRITWSSIITAQRLLAVRSVKEWGEEWFNPRFGLPSSDWRTARRGDVIVWDSTSPDYPGAGMGVCVGAMIAAPGLERVEFESIQRARFIWAVEK